MERSVTGLGADLMGVGASGAGGSKGEPHVRESPTIYALRHSSYFHLDNGYKLRDHTDMNQIYPTDMDQKIYPNGYILEG